MIVYHGSTVEIKWPDITHSKKYLDFGRGFYVTSFRPQAEKWAKRKAVRTNGIAIVNQYELSNEMSGYHILSFEGADEKWLEFICSCRQGEEIYKQYDLIIGNVANDDVFKTVDMYFRGLWEKERALEELRYYKKNDQICFVSNASLELLRFVKSYEVKL